MLEVIRSYTNTDEAYLTKGLLESNGIEAVIQDVGGNSVFPSLNVDNGSVNLLVEQKNARKAQEILRQHHD